MKAHSLKVPGATLYFETRGSGPLLLLIPGGPADAGVFDGLSLCLASRYTVVTCDPRGNSRSLLDGAPTEQDMDVHGDDAARLLASIGDEPACVFGSSGGAQIGLNLAARHSTRVHTLVAHEPPCLQLLADAADLRARTQAVYEIYRRDGVGSAMQAFMALAGMKSGAQQNTASAPSAEAMATFARMNGNLNYFLAHGLRPISLYVPDVHALRAGSVRLVVGIGQESDGELANRSARALAEKLGVAPALFPGDHAGYGAHPDEFSTILDRHLR